MYTEVLRLEKQLVKKGYMMLIRTESDVWKCETSFVIDTALQVTVLVHIPVARKDSYRTMYQYETTPLSTDGLVIMCWCTQRRRLFLWISVHDR